MTRDPRTDPMKGDVFNGPLGTVLTVTSNDGETVQFDLAPDASDHRPIRAFRRWARTATVIKLGDQGDGM